MKLKILKYKIPVYVNLNSLKNYFLLRNFSNFKFDYTILKNGLETQTVSVQ